MSQHDAGAAGFSTLLENLAQLDFFTLVLPFVLSYIVFFLALNRIKLFEEKQHAALIAVIASFFTAQFIATNPFYQTFFIEYFGRITIGMIGLLGLMVLLGLIGWNMEIFKSPALAVILISIVGAAFTASGGFGPPLLDGSDMDLSMLGPLLFDTGLIWILVIGGVIWWMSREENEEEEENGRPPLLKSLFNEGVWGDN